MEALETWKGLKRGDTGGVRSKEEKKEYILIFVTLWWSFFVTVFLFEITSLYIVLADMKFTM